MQEYRVTWKIEVDANNPEDAAKQALAIQRDPESTAVVFEVVDEKGNESIVDIMGWL